MPQHEAEALAAHAQQGLGGMAKPAELGYRRHQGQTEEAGAASPIAVWGPVRLQQAEENTMPLLHGNGFVVCSMITSS